MWSVDPSKIPQNRLIYYGNEVHSISVYFFTVFAFIVRRFEYLFVIFYTICFACTFVITSFYFSRFRPVAHFWGDLLQYFFFLLKRALITGSYRNLLLFTAHC